MLNRKIMFFISVVEMGSFSKAAREFFVSQSAVSQQIVRLEKELDVILFDRSGYRPVLTKAGKHYYDGCKSILKQYKKLEDETRNTPLSTRRILRIGITGPLENKYLPSIIDEYKKIYNDTLIEVKKIKFGSGVTQLEEGKLDVSFGITNDFKGKEDISTIKLLKQNVCVICSKKHPLAGKKSVSSRELANESIISLSKEFGKGFYIDFLEAFKKDGVKPNIVQEVDALEELLLVVEINQGIAFVSKEVVEENQNISVLDIKNTNHHAEFCLGYLESECEEHIRAFVNTTADYFNELYKKN